MNRTICTMSLVLVGLLLASVSSAGPFGLEMGMSLEEIGGDPTKIAPGVYRISTVPKPHSAFESYVVWVTPEHGLHYIKAIGKDISTNVYGENLRFQFGEMSFKLLTKYGQYNLDDDLNEGSIWEEDKYWMMALVKEERHLWASWPKKGHSLPKGLESVLLAGKATDQNTGYLVLEYGFSNHVKALVEFEPEEDDAL